MTLKIYSNREFMLKSDHCQIKFNCILNIKFGLTCYRFRTLGPGMSLEYQKSHEYLFKSHKIIFV